MEIKLENEIKTGTIWGFIGLRLYGAFQKPESLLADPHDKGHSILGSVLGSFYLWKSHTTKFPIHVLHLSHSILHY